MLCIAGLMCGPVRAFPGGRVEKIVAAGGNDGSRLHKVEVFDIASNTWETGGCCRNVDDLIEGNM